MVTIRFSKEKEIIVPISLGKALGLCEGDRVEVQRQDNVLQLQRQETTPSPGPLTDLAKIISSSRPVGSVDVEQYMDKHGYEQVHDSPSS